MQRISEAQFKALATLLRMQEASATRETARLVLVEGLPPALARRQTGVTRQSASQALESCKKGMALAQIASGVVV